MMKITGYKVVGRELIGGRWERTELGSYGTKRAANFAYARRHQYAKFQYVEVEPVYSFVGTISSEDPFAIFG